jgi:amidohydrolase
MHACGHDVHGVVMLSVAETLSQLRNEGLMTQPVSIRVIFQPAEETGQGAHESIAAGLIDGVDAILAMHVDPTREVGKIALRDGVQTACCDELRFVIEGSGGHGARPHETSDTILAAAHLIQSAHSLVPRIVDARDDSVLSICKVTGGNSANVIPTRVEMLGTLRSFSEHTRETILARLRTLANSTSALFNVNAEFLTTTTVPSVDNCPGLNQLVGDTCRRLNGEESVQQAAISLGGEDFACYQKHIPGSLIRIGSASGHRFGAHLHSPHFDVDEQVIGVACRLLVHSLLEWSLRNN